MAHSRRDELLRQGSKLSLVAFGELLRSDGLLLLGLDDFWGVVLGVLLLLRHPGRLLRLELDLALGHGRVGVTGARWIAMRRGDGHTQKKPYTGYKYGSDSILKYKSTAKNPTM